MFRRSLRARRGLWRRLITLAGYYMHVCMRECVQKVCLAPVERDNITVEREKISSAEASGRRGCTSEVSILHRCYDL